MSSRVVEPGRPNRRRTQMAVRNAVREVKSATHPRIHSVRDAMSWFVALAGGALIAWRGIEAVREEASTTDNSAIKPPVARLQEDRRIEAKQHNKNNSTNKQQQLLSNTKESIVKPAVTARATVDLHNRTGLNNTNTSDLPITQSASGVKIEENLLGYGKEFIARFNDDNCASWAASLSFFGILTLVPLLLFAMAALGFFIHDPNETRQYVQHFISNLLPGREASQAAEEVIQKTNLVESARTLMHRKWWSVVFGLLSLFYTALGLFVNASAPMNAAWEIKETRGYFKLRQVCLLVFAGAGLFFLMSLLVSSDLLHPKNMSLYFAVVLAIVFEFVAIGLNAVMFTLIYRYLPNTTVTWRAALFGGLIAGLLFELMKKGFEFYLAHFGNMNNKMYGALGGIVLLVTWIYYSSMLLLSGALIAKMYHEHREEGGVRRRGS